MPTLDNLRKEAKRWLKALRMHDPAARARLINVYPTAPARPGLRDVQLALARERGHRSWTALKASVDSSTATLVEAVGGRTHAERVETFLTYACWDHRVHGKGDHRMYDHAARRLLAHHPEVARDSLYTAIVCGDLDAARRILTTRPDAAREPGGARGWTPLLYLCFTRFSHRSTIDNAVAIGRALLDAGANPNDFYMAGDSRYTALVGVAGEGEQDSPRQPYAAALFQLLLERGAHPFDIQVLYNTHFSGDVLWWLELVHAQTMKAGLSAAWEDPDWLMLGMGGYGPGAYFLLRVAVQKNDLTLAEWLLTHGASPNLREYSHPRFRPTMTLYQEASSAGSVEMADLLLRHGATPTPAVLAPEAAFVDACFHLDRAGIRAGIEQHPEFLQSPAAIFAAAQKDRADVVELLLDLGVPIEIEGRHGERTLHEAAGANARRVARLLIERGAEIDPIETAYGGTPIGWAAHGDHVEMMDLLSRCTRDVWTLAFNGYVARLSEVLRAQPDLARAVASDGTTPLCWLPDDETKAIETVELFLSHGADLSIRSKDGRTAADRAVERGMLDVARRLGVYGTSATAPPVPSPELENYESLARDLLFAFETGHAAAMQHLQAHYGRTFAWQELRAAVRERMNAIPGSQRPDGYFALAHARLLVAREAGFTDWTTLAQACR